MITHKGIHAERRNCDELSDYRQKHGGYSRLADKDSDTLQRCMRNLRISAHLTGQSRTAIIGWIWQNAGVSTAFN